MEFSLLFVEQGSRREYTVDRMATIDEGRLTAGVEACNSACDYENSGDQYGGTFVMRANSRATVDWFVVVWFVTKEREHC